MPAEPHVPPAIEAQGLTRRFGELLAVDGLSFEVSPGEIFGVLGPNGAGKTTTVRLLNGLLRPSAGAARVLGLDPATHGGRVRARAGVLTETPSLYERLSARENLLLFGNLYGVPQAELPARVDRQLKFFDLAARAPLFLCTHNLAEAQRLCQQVAVLDRGRLLARGSVSDLAGTLWRGLWLDVELYAPPPPGLADALRAADGVVELTLDDRCLAVQVAGPRVVPAVVAAVVGCGGQVSRVNPREHSLEEIYFELRRQRSADPASRGPDDGRRPT